MEAPLVKIRVGHAVNGAVVDVDLPNGKTSARFYPSSRVIKPEPHQMEAAAMHAVYLSERLGCRVLVKMETRDIQIGQIARVHAAAAAQGVGVAGLVVEEAKA